MQPPVQWVPVFFPGDKAVGAKADHSLPSSDEVKNEWSCTFASMYTFMARTDTNFTSHLFLNIPTGLVCLGFSARFRKHALPAGLSLYAVT